MPVWSAVFIVSFASVVMVLYQDLSYLIKIKEKNNHSIEFDRKYLKEEVIPIAVLN